MSTNYPVSFDSYTAKTDGVDVVMAADINNLQDAVSSIEVELGTMPKGSYSSVAAALNGKLNASGGTLTGNLAADAGVKVDGVDISAHAHTGTTGDAPKINMANLDLTADVNLGFYKVTSLGTPTSSSDGATKGYADTLPATTANTFSIGDGASGTKTIVANNYATNKPALRFNDSSQKWQYSNDGTNFKNMLSTGTSVYSLQNVAGSSTAVVADFVVPTGKTLNIRALGSLLSVASDKTIKVRNVTDSVDVASITSTWDGTGWSVVAGKNVQFQLVNGNSGAQDIGGMFDFEIQ